MRFFFSLFLLATLLFLNACDPGYSLDYAVKNDSSTPVSLAFWNAQKRDSATVAPFSEKIVAMDGGLGTASAAFSNFPVDSLVWNIRQDSLPCKKDVNNKTLWIFTETGRSRFGSRTGRADFSVTDADF